MRIERCTVCAACSGVLLVPRWMERRTKLQSREDMHELIPSGQKQRRLSRPSLSDFIGFPSLFFNFFNVSKQYEIIQINLFLKPHLPYLFILF